MCGICGILDVSGEDLRPGVVERFSETLAHRGPDGCGVHIDGPMGLAHRRLAIIDLETGAQPLANEDGSVWLAFNGEIYNFRELRSELVSFGHVFKTNADSEAIIHAYEQWGFDCLQRLRGMFAFAVWDADKRRLFLARDRLGIKPLCYYQDQDRFAFASELQAFRALTDFAPTLDLQALDLYLHLQYIPAPFSIYREVRKLPPAHYLVVDHEGRVSGPTRYWDLTFRPDHRPSESEWVERLDAALAEAVKAHLVSDVPFGAFLSGGVDSSTVVGYMSRLLNRSVKTFTIGFDDVECDERAHAQQAAEILGTTHHVEVVHPDALDLLPRLVAHYGEPFADSSSICTYLVSQSARRHVKMVLSGDGGDEIFAGYSYYPKMLQQFPTLTGRLRRGRRYLGNLTRGLGLLSPLPSPSQAWHNRSPFFDETLRARLWRPEFQEILAGSAAWNEEQFAPVRQADLLSQCQYVDIHNYLPYDNLNKVDIASMAHGLEVRVPLLDHLLLDTVTQIPPHLRVRFGGTLGSVKSNVETKYLFKKVGQQFFPTGFFDREKKGFSVPINRWMRGMNSDDLRDRLFDQPAIKELFSANYIDSLIHGPDKNNYFGHRCWSLLFLAEWLRQFPVSIR